MGRRGPALTFLARHRNQTVLATVISVGELDRELIRSGGRLGENDNWVAGFCRYYGQPVISRDVGFDRVRGLRRLAY